MTNVVYSTGDSGDDEVSLNSLYCLEEVIVEGWDDPEAAGGFLVEPVDFNSSAVSTPQRIRIARRGSEPRILLDQADLRLASDQEHDEDITTLGSRKLSYHAIHEEDATSEKATLSLSASLTAAVEDDDGGLDAGDAAVGLTSARAQELLLLHGPNELPCCHTPKWLLFVSQLWQPMPLMIWVAVIVLCCVQAYPDAGLLIALNLTNAFIAFWESSKSGDAVDALKASLRPTAVVKRDLQWQRVDAAVLVPGDVVSLSAGRNVPADCLLHSSEVEVDQSSLTGESLPVTMFRHDQCKMGSHITRGESEATVMLTGANTYFGTTATLLGSDAGLGATNNSNLQSFLQRIVVVLTTISLVLVTIALVYLLLGTPAMQLDEALRFIVVLLVASIPLAIEIISTTTLALGSTEAAQHGVICTRLAALEDLASMNVLASDKTGTLTMNCMKLQEEAPCYAPGQDRDSLLLCAAMSTRWLEPPRDALDTLILHHVDKAGLQGVTLLDAVAFDPVIKRAEGTVRIGRHGPVFKTSKGSPHVILALCSESVHQCSTSTATGDSSESDSDSDSGSGSGSDSMTGTRTKRNIPYCIRGSVAQRVEHDVRKLGRRGVRCLAVARTIPLPPAPHSRGKEGGKEEEEVWQFLGLLTFLDPPRADAKQTISEANALGIKVIMVTGDHLLIAKEVARTLHMGAHILHRRRLPSLCADKSKPADLVQRWGKMIKSADGFAEVYPEHKYLVVECLRELGYKVGMTGDGVNDAPALKAADVGVAVQGSTDAAKAAADLVLTEEGLGALIHGLRIARQTFNRIRSFLVYRIAATLQLLLFFFIAVFIFTPADYQPPADHPTGYVVPRPWPKAFFLPVLLLMLITILNDGTLISVAYDHAIPSPQPERWSMATLFLTGAVLAAIASASSLLLLYACLNSWQADSVYQRAGLGPNGLSFGQIIVSIFLKVSVSDFLTLFTARAGEQSVLTAPPPSPTLMLCGALALIISTAFALAFPEMSLDDVSIEGLARRGPAGFVLIIWVYCILVFFLQDAAKVGTVALLHQRQRRQGGLGIVKERSSESESEGTPEQGLAGEEKEIEDATQSQVMNIA